MRAVLCKAHGPPDTLVLADVPIPSPGPGQVRVRVQAAGVNFPDLLMIQGLYQFRPPFPFSPGGEVSGEVSALGEGVTGVRLGDPVIAFCGHGGFAEEVVVPVSRLLPIPEGMDRQTAGAFALTYATSYHALVDRGRLRAGETLLVLGAAGGVGLAAVEIGKALGARVIAAARGEGKLAVCRDHGADEVVDYAAADLRPVLKELTGGRGVDVVYDPVGGPHSEPALRSLAWEGRHLVVGFASGEIPRVPWNLVLLKGCQVVGVFWGAYFEREAARHAEGFARLGRWFVQGKLRPLVSRTYALDEAAAALRDLRDRKIIGKACLLVR